MITVGVIGAGYWGPNLIRNYVQLPSANLKWVADLDRKRLDHIATLYPSVQVTQDAMELIRDDAVQAVVIATPPHTHTELGLAALAAGKHVFIEKPLADTLENALKLESAAKESGLVLMCGHTFLYNAAVTYLKGLVDAGELGKLFYLRSQRLSLGLYQQTIDVVWDLGPHDVSIALHMLDNRRPRRVAATGGRNINPDVVDVANITLEFEDGTTAYIQNSWLDPNKVRQLTLVGQKKMAVYDDLEPLEKIRIYDKAVEVPGHADTFGEWQYSYRYGDIVTPHLRLTEPLANECRHFIECITEGRPPISGPDNAVQVIRVLDAASKSLAANGAFVDLG